MRQLKAPEGENTKLKTLLAKAMLDNALLKVLLQKIGNACYPAGGSGGSTPGA